MPLRRGRAEFRLSGERAGLFTTLKTILNYTQQVFHTAVEHPLPALAAQISNAAIVTIPFKKPAPSRTIALVFRKTHVRSALFQQMAKIIS